MFENFKKIAIRGACFEAETGLELFKNDSISIVYGRNGSGKTTIAKAFRELQKDEVDENSELSVSSEAIVSDEFKSAIHVFDEDFVSSQVSFNDEGVQTIVMLGEQVEIDHKIEVLKREIDGIVTQMQPSIELQKRYENVQDSLSPQYYFEQIRTALRADGGWADIECEIKNNKVKSRVTYDVIKSLAELPEPRETLEKLQNQLRKNLTLFKTTTDAQLIEWNVTAPALPPTLVEVSELLQRRIEQPELSDRELRLLELTRTSFFSHSTTRRLIEDKWEFCPLCLRDLTDGDRTHLAHELSLLLNEQAEKYLQLLDQELHLFEPLSIALPPFPEGLNQNEVNALKDASDKMNRIINVVHQKLQARRQQIYGMFESPFNEDEFQAYISSKSEFERSLESIRQCVDKFNATISEHNKLKRELLSLNQQVARKQLAVFLKAYTKAQEDMEKNQIGLLVSRHSKQQKDLEIKSLQQQKERTDLALEYINQELSYVFYSNRKLKLISGDGCYRLIVNGRHVRPSKISVGERNALALCYFFAKLYSGKTDADKYASEYLIVIDDPVSSFDYGNRVGIMSLLRYQCASIHNGNPNSRILILSHDIPSVFNLVKIRNEICCRRGQKHFLELADNHISEQMIQNEYMKLLHQTYDYALGTTTEQDDTTIGNVMRRMLEAFSSFCYNKGFEEMLRMPSLLSSIPEDRRPYYDNFMSRLTLNGESHEAENVYALNTITPFFTQEEKIRTARSILLFLYYINKPHLEAYLKDDKVLEIERWRDGNLDIL